MNMNRDSRKVYAFLSSVCNSNNIDYEFNHRDIYLLDKLMVKYYPNPVITLIKSKIKSIKFSQKHATISYWYTIIDNIFKNNMDVKRMTQNIQYTLPDELAAIIYWEIISNYLICDYSYDDMVLLQTIVNRFKNDDIQYAINVGKNQDIYNVRYLNAVLERQEAHRIQKKMKIEKINRKVEESNKLLDNEIHEHNMLDMAQAEWNWKNTYDNMVIENQLNKIKGDR
jgi:hypothetical protein